MSNTTIEWTDKVWNPVTGCTKVSAGCKNCYAERIMNRFCSYTEYSSGVPVKKKTREFTDVQCHENRLNQPLKWKKPCKIFVNSMSDLFHPDVPFEFIDKVYAVMALCPEHIFQILTKRPERMKQYFDYDSREESVQAEGRKIINNSWYQLNKNKEIPSPWFCDKTTDEDGFEDIRYWYEGDFPLPNVWLGVSVEDQKTADERIPILLQVPAVRFISCEPLLGNINLENIFYHNEQGYNVNALEGFHYDNIKETYLPTDNKIDWVIVGGESGHNARPMHPKWARSLKEQCDNAEVPFFFKQWGEWLHRSHIANDDKELLSCHSIEAEPDCGPEYNRFYRVGKKRAGCWLECGEWKDFPEVGV